jgi:hypothetical protein
MARKFINMFLESDNYYGYWLVEYIDNDGIIKIDRFSTDLEAKKFYNELILESQS